MSRLVAFVLASACCAAALAVPAGAAPVRSATVLVGRGVDVLPQQVRVELGMTRRALMRALGTPVEQNRFGYLGYARARRGIFDVFVNPTNRRVDLVVVGLVDTCLASRICLFEDGGLGRLQAKFGAGLHRVQEPGGPRYRVRVSRDGRTIVTDFETDGDEPSSRLLSVTLALPA